MIRVHVEIDFGPVGKPVIKKTVNLKEGATVLDATKAAVPLKQGFVCCDPEDVETIAGVSCDPEIEGWWLYEVNREKGPVSAHRFQVKDGDRVRWHYDVRGSLKEKPVVPYRVVRGSWRGSISGEARVAGDLPALPPFGIHKNHEACGTGAKPHPCAEFFRPGGVKRAVAWIEEMAEGKAWSTIPSAVMDQRGCEFTPHLTVLPVGRELEIKNSDGVLHTVHAYDRAYRTYFHARMKGKSSRHVVTLDQPGVWDLQCDAGHRWMKAHVIVLQNPYYVISDDQGRFELKGVPPGAYRLHVWHDGFGLASQPVTVKDGRETRVSVTWTPEQFRIDTRYAE